MFFDLDGKVAVVTGAGSGIGRAITQRLSAAGATVVLADIKDASELATEVGGRYVAADVSVEDDVQALMAEAATLTGAIDICINNVGMSGHAPVEQTDRDHTARVFAVNAIGTLLGMKHVVEYMPAGGAIVNTASIAGVIGYPTYSAYGASKFAVVGLTRIAAIEYGARGIRVNCVCPSSVNTPMLAVQSNGASEVATLGAGAAVKGLVEPEEVAALVHFLVAGDCNKISGQAIVIDGGLTAGISQTFVDLASAGL